MGKTIFFIRHAKSSWADPGLRDIERPLNKRGLRDAPFMAKLLRDRIRTVDKLVSSPAVRAKTTAGFFADSFGMDTKDILIEKAIYEAYPNTLVEIVRGLDDAWDTVLIFGHNPGFTAVANEFSDYYIDNVPTCGIFKIFTKADTWNELNSDNAQMTEFHYPKQYFT